MSVPEFAADAGAVALTGNPAALASALVKVSDGARGGPPAGKSAGVRAADVAEERRARIGRLGPGLRLDSGLERIEPRSSRDRHTGDLPAFLALAREPAVRAAVGMVAVELGGSLFCLLAGHDRTVPRDRMALISPGYAAAW
jgi:hypothetical protein